MGGGRSMRQARRDTGPERELQLCGRVAEPYAACVCIFFRALSAESCAACRALFSLPRLTIQDLARKVHQKWCTSVNLLGSVGCTFVYFKFAVSSAASVSLGSLRPSFSVHLRIACLFGGTRGATRDTS